MMKIKSVVGIILFYLLVFILDTNLWAQAWREILLDDHKNFSLYHTNGTFVDQSGFPHIVYGGDHLYYAYMDQSGWHDQIIDSSQNVGINSSIAVDSSGKVHVIYYDADKGCLKYASNGSSGVWNSVSLGIPFLSHRNISMTIDSSDKLHLVYYDIDLKSLMHLVYSDNVWTSFDILNPDGEQASNVNSYPQNISIFADASDNIHIGFIEYAPDYNAGYLKYATNKSGKWQVESVENFGAWNAGDFTKVVVNDATGSVHIGFTVTYKVMALPGSCYGDCNYTDFKYAAKLNGTWNIDTVGTTGHYAPSDDTLPYGDRYYFGLSVDASDGVSFSYLYYDEGIKFGSNSSGVWAFTTVDPDGMVRTPDSYAGNYLALVEDNSHAIHLSYFDETDSSIKYAHKSADSSWLISDVAACNQAGRYLDGAIDTQDKMHLSYYSDTSGDLKYATNASGGWKIETLDSQGNVGLYNSISLDSLGYVHISYFDETNSTVKYVSNSSGDWHCEVVVLPTAAYPKTAIALDAMDRTYILYLDTENSQVKYAVRSTDGWHVFPTTVDSVSSYRNSLDIVFDALDNMHICYYNAFGFFYASDHDGIWASEKIGSSTSVAGKSRDCSIIIDQNDNVHLGYQVGCGDGYNFFCLKYVTNISGSWVYETVDSGYEMGNHSSCSADNSGNIHFSYQKGSSLKYADNTLGTWESEQIASYALTSDMVVSPLSGDIYLAYGNSNDGDLKVVTNTSSSFEADIDEDGDVDGLDLANWSHGTVVQEDIIAFAQNFGRNS